MTTREDRGVEAPSIDKGGSGRGGENTADLTALLRDWRRGVPGAEETLIRLVYPTLRRIAARELARHASRPSLQVTDLVHETYLRVARPRPDTDFENRAHFLNFMARATRHMLVDLARRGRAKKRDLGELSPIHVESRAAASLAHPDILSLESALERLLEIDELAVRVVELRYFAGLTVEETQEALEVGRTTVVRKWRYARSWLRNRLKEQP
jgi:RNA polymerase sigma factor (TIGR02999 family)